MTYTATDISQVIEIPGCTRISAQQDGDCYRLVYRLPNGNKFMVILKMEGEEGEIKKYGVYKSYYEREVKENDT